MSAPTMSEEIRAIDLRDARREVIRRDCERRWCGKRGIDFLDGQWLCRDHLADQLREYIQEAYRDSQ